MWLEPCGEDSIFFLESGILSRLLISILPISRNRAPRELVTVLEGPEEEAGGDKGEEEEGGEGDTTLVSDLLITG
jgi:hypothetical protein